MSSDNHNNSILYIGDSHSVTSFGQTILNNLQTHSHQHIQNTTSNLIYYYAVSGSQFSHWLNEGLNCFQIKNYQITPKSSAIIGHINVDFQWNLLNLVKFDYLIIALGTNDLIFNETNSLIQTYNYYFQSPIYKDIENKISKKIFWLAPPFIRNDILNYDLQNKWHEFMSQQNSFTFLKNSGFHADQSDGIHLLQKTGISFGQQMSNELIKQLN